MSSRQNWFWVSLAALLLILIFFHHHFSRKGSPTVALVFPDLKSASVNAVQVRVAGQPEIRAERTNASWVLTDPVNYPAQSNSVETLLAALATMKPAAHITPAELKNRPEAEEEYGLAAPRITIILQGDFRERIAIGTNTPPGDQIFLKVGRDSGIYVVDSDFLRVIPKNPKDWRDTAFFELGNVIPDRIAVTNGPRPFELERAGSNNVWHLLLPGFVARADNARIEEMVAGLQNLRVHDFISDDPKGELEAFGLQNPDLQLAIRNGTNLLGILQFGKTATNNTHEVYARRLGQKSIVTVSRDLLEPWRSVDKFRDPFLISFTAPIGAIEVQGQDNFALEGWTNQSWRVLPEGLRADVGLVKELLSSLGGMQIVQFVRDVVPGPDLGTWGLTNYSLRYVLKSALSNTTALADIQFGSTQEDKVFVKRADENNVYAVTAAAFQRLGSASWEFRDRAIWNIDEKDVANVTIKHAGRTRQINRKAQFEWSLAPGSQGLIESLPVDQTVKGLCGLSATAWVARGEKNRALYGLTNDNFVVTLELKNGVKHSIEFGRKSPSSFPYGAVKLDGDLWIFEVPLSLCRDILLYLSIPESIN